MAKCPSALTLAWIGKDNIIYVLILISCDSLDAILKKGLRATGWGEGTSALYYASLVYFSLFSCVVTIHQIFLLMFLFLIIFKATLDSNV